MDMASGVRTDSVRSLGDGRDASGKRPENVAPTDKEVIQ